MKTIVVKICALALVLSLALALVSCSGMTSSYSATMLIRSSVGGSYTVKFDSLRGRLVQKLSNADDQDGALLCTASLEEGELSVYYVTSASDAKQPLFSLKGGESITAERLGYLTNGEDPRIVIETAEGGARGGEIKIEITR